MNDEIVLGFCEHCNQGRQQLKQCAFHFVSKERVVTRNGIKAKTVENLFCDICTEMFHKHTGEAWA